jgi:hypothetical protein
MVAIGGAIYCVQVWLYNTLIDDSLLVSVRDYQLAAWRAEGLTGAVLSVGHRPARTVFEPACVCRRRAAR